MVICIHDLEQRSCGVCSQPRRPAPPPRRLGPWFSARYESECDCGEPIRPGDDARSDGDGGWLCADCGAR